ncbi:hypothetical protein [Paraburkholderia youngii]|uniref:hypothetical protein n=1 Tax=Paraburkholderia youngii TaxID=2782701 RepID=UPI003D1D7BD6
MELQEPALPDAIDYRTYTLAHLPNLPDLDKAVEIGSRLSWWGIRLAFMIRFTVCQWSGMLLSRLRSA